MAISSYDKGDIVRIKAEFLDVNDSPVDPSTLTIIVTNAGGAATTYVYGTDIEVKRTSTGLYYIDYPIPNSCTTGQWKYKIISTGIGQAAEEGKFFVKK